MKPVIVFIFLPLFFLLSYKNALAAQIVLTNGDRLSGNITSREQTRTGIDAFGIGPIFIQNEFIREIIDDQKKLWSGKVTSAFNRQRGNVEMTALGGGFQIKRKVEKKNEFDIQANSFYGEQNRQMNDQRYDGFIRWAYSFLPNKKAYHFFKTEGDHNRFANIDGRATPSTGLGYWFSDQDAWKALFETGIGVTFTNYRDETKSRTEVVLIPRIYLEKRLIGELRASEEFIWYPSLSRPGEHRFKSEAALKNPITKWLDLKFSLVNEFNSDPSGEAKKHDLRLTSGVEYKF